MLQVNQLVKEYRKFRAVDNLNFSVAPGEIVGILGPNGAGKTTALRCIAGILRPTSGQILIGGHDIVHQQSKAKAFTAFVPEVPSLYELLTVDEHLKFVAMCFNRLDLYEAKGTDLLDKYDLLEKKNELVATLSKGMRQKLSVACAMVHDAKLFLFDEPLIGIDPKGVAEIKQEIHEAAAGGGSVLISTHLLDTAEKLCDRILIIARGKLLFDGTLASLRNNSHDQDASLESLFLRLTGESELATPPISS